MSTEENKVSQEPKETQKPNENSGVYMEGHIKYLTQKPTKYWLTNVMLFTMRI